MLLSLFFLLDPFVIFCFTIQINIIQRNVDSYLSAGEINLPSMYAVMAVIAFFTSLFWVHVLWRHRAQVFKIHYLMALFMFIKALSITFHAVSYCENDYKR